MKFIKITHYVEKSYEDKPSFVILMSDDKEYISNGCVFVENTPENINELIETYDCEYFIDELMNTAPIEMKDVVDARHMFNNSQLTKFDSDMSSVVDARHMFNNTPYSGNKL